jgi:hypothetical protein
VIGLGPDVQQFVDANADERLLDHFAVPQQRPFAAPFRPGWAAAQQ